MNLDFRGKSQMIRFAKIIYFRLLDLKAVLYNLLSRGRDKMTVWIVGDGRSGSTWLQEMINYDNRYKCMFEPFHPTQVEEMKDLEFYKYIRPGQKDESFYKLAAKVFSGKIYHPRVIRGDRRFNRKLLIKDIFANLFIKWASVNFPEVKKILIMRHPFATALSKQKLENWDWLTEPIQFLDQRELFQDYLEPYEDLIRKTEGYFEKQVLVWSIIHYVAFKQLNERDVILVFYEDLCSDPENELRRIFSSLYESEQEHILDPKLVEKIKSPSFTSRKNSAINRGGNLCDVWRKDLTESNIDNGIEILKSFGLDCIYNRGLMPDRLAAERLLKISSER